MDLLADQAGIRFAANAISDEPHAIAIRDRIEKGLVIQDVMPSIDALPEGHPTDRFQTEYGGMGWEKDWRASERHSVPVETLLADGEAALALLQR